MRNKIFTLISALTIAGSLMAAVGPQSVKVTFNGDNSEGWTVASPGSLSSFGSGVANVTMAIPEGKDKYRADFQFNTTGFTMDKSKDIVWAIKLTAALPGTTNSRKFEIQYNDGSDKWINGISGPSGTLDCTDGGKIYYFNLGSDGLNKLSGLPEGTINVKQIHFIMADAVIENEADAHYSVDWVATFTSVNDLKAFQDWTDEAQEANAALPYFEACFRPKASEDNYENGYPYNGFKNTSFEGNYQAGIFAIEYFLIDNFDLTKVYTIVLQPSATNNAAISVWDFPYQINAEISANEIKEKATTVVGFAPRGSGDANTPIVSATCENSKWTLALPARKLTKLASVGTKTMVGLLVTTRDLTTNSSAKFAPAANATASLRPALTQTGTDESVVIVNTTQQTIHETLAASVADADDNDVITLYGDVTISGSRLEILKPLTIQGATGAEKLICGVNASTLMVLANGSETDYTVTFKNLIVDGQNTSRSTQTFDANSKGQFCFENVRFINTSYSIVCGDVKNNGNAVLLKGDNSFPNGIYLNKNKRIDGKDATHATPIKVYLSSDYVEYVTILCSNDPAQYEAISANNSTGWLLEVSNSGSCSHELKTKKCLQYDLEVKAAAGMATMVIGFDAELPDGVKAYQLVYDNSPEYADGICAYEENSITKNKPVLVIAEPGTYAFKSVAGATLDEQANPEYGALKGVYAAGYIPACSAGVYNYALTSGTDGVGFYQVADATNAIGAHRAYLSCSYDSQAGGGSAPRRMALHFDAHKTPTAIESAATTDSAEKLLIDGIIYIRRAEHLYRIDGQQVK